MQFDDTLKTAVSGMSAQATRLRVISENLASSDSTATTPGGDPYRRKVVTFKTVLDKSTGESSVTVGHVALDAAPFQLRYQPGHPAADDKGYVRYPNVNPLLELADMREAQRSYQANVDVIDTAKTMLSRAIDLLRS